MGVTAFYAIVFLCILFVGAYALAFAGAQDAGYTNEPCERARILCNLDNCIRRETELARETCAANDAAAATVNDAAGDGARQACLERLRFECVRNKHCEEGMFRCSDPVATEHRDAWNAEHSLSPDQVGRRILAWQPIYNVRGAYWASIVWYGFFVLALCAACGQAFDTPPQPAENQ